VTAGGHVYAVGAVVAVDGLGVVGPIVREASDEARLAVENRPGTG